MSADLTPFGNDEFSLSIQMHDVDGFRVNAPGLARALGFREAYDLLRSIPEGEKGSEIVRTPGGEQAVGYVTEAGFYRSLGQRQAARIPDVELRAKVERFQNWVYGDVLPSIRQTGSYDGLDLSDPLAAIESANTRTQMAVEIAKAERIRAAKAEKQVEIEQRHRRAIEGGDGILLTDFGKKYFSEVRHTDFFEHLYAKKWLIDQRGTRLRPDGEVRNGYDHAKPTYKGRLYIYEHDQGNHGGKRRFQPRVRPQKEIELRDLLAAEGLPVNMHSTGLVLVSNDELKGLGA
jgi:prophage antirepressor-like protein